MKKLILLSLVSLLFTSSAFAAWRAQMRFFASPVQINAQVFNPKPYPIHCWGNVFGSTMRGAVLNAWFNNVIYPGEVRSTFVGIHDPRYDRFVGHWSNIVCEEY